jgi:hypothetical protein
MSDYCPSCGKALLRRPGLFTFNEIVCQSCHAQIRTNIRSRLLLILSFTLLVMHHLYIRKLEQAMEQSLLWLGLLAVMVPIFMTFRLPRLEVGEQRSGHSLLANGVFFLVVGLLAYLWVFP